MLGLKEVVCTGLVDIPNLGKAGLKYMSNSPLICLLKDELDGDNGNIGSHPMSKDARGRETWCHLTHAKSAANR
jgi:hypothetical protein